MDCRASVIRFFSTAILIAAAPPVWGQDGPIVARHPVLVASLDRISAKSPSWREAVAAIAASGRRVFIVTPEKVRVQDDKGGDRPFDRTVLAEVHPIADEDSRVDTVIVVMNLELLQKLSRLPVTAMDFEADVDRILAHEVYGHAIPYLLAGTLAGKCADPAPGESATNACAVQRENVIRAEMGLGRRFEYGRESLALARRYWHE